MCIRVQQTQCFRYGPPLLNHSLDYSRTLTMVITVPYTKGSSQCDTEPNTYVILQTSNKPHIVKNTLEMHEPIKRKSASSINTPLEPCMSSIKSIKINTKISNKHRRQCKVSSCWSTRTAYTPKCNGM